MRLLLDTHTFLWWLIADRQISDRIRAVVDEADAVFVSAATAWEIHTKFRLGKLPDAGPFITDLAAEAARDGFEELPVSFADGARAGVLPGDRKDPFDRMLAAQAINHNLALVSNDTALDAFGIVRVW